MSVISKMSPIIRSYMSLSGVRLLKGFSNNLIKRQNASNAAAAKFSDVVTKDLKPMQEIPGPSSLPIIGQLKHFLPGGDLYNLAGYEMWKKVYDKYGSIVRLDSMFGRPAIIVIFDPDCTAYVLRSENWLPIRPGFDSLTYYRKSYLKTKEQADKPAGLISDQGSQWKQFRSTVNPVMLQSKTIRLYSNSLREVAEDMIVRMKSMRDNKNMITEKFDIEMNLWALESIGVVALGGRLNCLDSNLPADSPAKKLIESVHEAFVISEQLDFKPSLWRYISTPTFKKAMKIYEDQYNVTKFFVNKALVKLKRRKNIDDDEKGILEKLLEIDEEVAVIMASDMLFAGVDTASNTITGVLYHLGNNIDKQNTLRREILAGQDTKYLKACIKESMRMLPITSGTARISTKDYNILGYKVPKDTLVAFAHQFISMEESQFPRPFEYLPERWIVSKDDPLHYGKAHPFAFSPFGFGVRSCIGRRIAELEIETFLGKLIENFHVEWFGPPIKAKSTTLNYLQAPFNFIFKDVK